MKFRDKLSKWHSLQFAFISVGDWWEEIKTRAKDFFIREGKKAAKKKRFALKKQQAQLQQLYTMAHSGFNVTEEITILKKDMLRLSTESSKGLIMRSRVHHIENNEKCSRYFFRKLARPKNIMESLKDENGTELFGTENILTRVFNFYSNLYRGEDCDKLALSNLLFQARRKMIEDVECLERDFSVDELSKALNSMQNNKAPGGDGLPKEFYVTFWSELKDPLLAVYNESLQLGRLPTSLREGTISLLLKKGDKRVIKNWRPLTLLCVDSKILAKALFSRLQSVAGKVVENDQTCGIPGRSINDNLALVRDSYLFALDRNLPLSILGLDLEKAFDRINHTYLREVLVHFGFGPKLRAWIDLLYNDCTSRVIVNGQLTKSIEVQSGVRQGCPLSPILFIIAMEPLACAIRQDPAIRGLPVPGTYGKEAKLSLYMDDLTLLTSDNESVNKSLQWCDQFSSASGAKLNRAKSEIFYLNWAQTKPDLGLVEQEEDIKILGVYIGKNMTIVNWNPRLPKIQGKLAQWETRELTVTGKILVIKSEILASLTSMAATLPVPISFLSPLRRALFQFLWGSQQERVRRDIMYKPLQKGGKAVPEIGVKLEALFLTPIINACIKETNCGLWSHFAKFWVGREVLSKIGRRAPLITPFAETRPKIYGKVTRFLKTHRFDMNNSDHVKRSVIEECILPESTQMVPVSILTEKKCALVWKNVNCPFLFNVHKDLAWHIVHDCLMTKSFLKKRRSSNDDKCPRTCMSIENSSHVFWSCFFAQRVWRLINPWLTDLYKTPTQSDILYGDFQANKNSKTERWWAAINCIKEGLWKARNLMFFKHFPVSPKTVINVSLSAVQDYVNRDNTMYVTVKVIELWKVSNVLTNNVLQKSF